MGVLGGREVTGYEIRHGATETTAPVTGALPAGLGYVAGPVLGIYLHGLFEQPDLVAALTSEVPTRTLQHVFEDLADAVEANLDLTGLLAVIGMRE